MRKLLLILFFLLLANVANAQSVVSLCSRVNGAQGGPQSCVPVSSTNPLPITGISVAAGGNPGDIQYNNNGSFGGISPVNGDCLVASGGAWGAGACSGTASSNLGTSSSVASPQRIGDAGTGLFSAATGTVSVATAGVDLVDISSSGFNFPAASVVFKNGNNSVMFVGNSSVSNTFLGNGAGQNVTTGGEDVYVGNSAANFQTTGTFNVAVGQHCLGYDTVSNSVVCIGNDTMRNAVGVGGSIAIGKSVMAWGTHGADVGVGFQDINGNSATITVNGTGTAGDVLTATFSCSPYSGYACSYSGTPIPVTYTVASNGQSANSMASGLCSAINANTTIANNTDNPAVCYVLGAPAPTNVITVTFTGTSTSGRGISISTSVTGSTETMSSTGGYNGQSNVALGQLSMQMQQATTASFNFGVGKYALNNLTTGSYNISIGGFNTAESVTSGSNNFIMCQSCATNLTTGNNNIVVGGGNIANTNLTTGSNNILLGPSNLDALTSGGSNYIDIGNAIFGDNSVYSVWLGGGSLSTGATDGFLEMSSTSGTPTGTPTAHSGYIPLVYNTATNALYAYNSGWQNISGSGGSATLGTAVGSPAPYRSGQTNTGLYSAASGTVSFASSGSDVLDVQSTGINLATAGTISQGGTQTVKILTTGNQTVAVGAGAVATGNQSISVGYDAGSGATGGFQNTFIGGYAGQYASNNSETFTGYQAGQYDNQVSATAYGNQAMQFYNGGYSQVAVGPNAMQYGTGNSSIAVGADALQGNSASVAVGGTTTNSDGLTLTFTGSFTGSPVSVTYTAVTGNTQAQNATGIAAAVNSNSTLSTANIKASTATGPSGVVYVDLQYPGGTSYATVTTAVGGSATETLTAANGVTGVENVAIGINAMFGLYGLSTASDNVAIGKQVGESLTTGGGNVMVGGYSAGYKLTTGSNNILLGTGAGASTLATGSNNIVIGVGLDTPTASTSNYMNLGGSITVVNQNVPSVETVTINGSTTFAGPAISGGTKFTASGCSNSTTTGGATAGSFASGTTGACTVVITLNGATGGAAPNGWACHANDLTTPADVIAQTATTTTTATLSGMTVSGDTVNFYCMGY